MRRRLFQRLEQRVERSRGEHVHFVYDVDLVACVDRRIARTAEQVAHVVDAGVGGGVELEHVGMAPVRDGRAMDAGRVELHRWLMDVVRLVVQRASQQARRRRLADAAHAGEHEGMRDAAGPERIGERADHRLLPDKVLEPGRTVFAGEHLVDGGPKRHVVAEHGCGQRVAGFRNIIHRPVFGRFRRLLRGHAPLWRIGW